MTEPLLAWSDEEGAGRAAALFAAALGGEPDGVWASPGRVNLIGEHVDYNGGLCLPMALPHRTFAAVRRRDDDVVRLVSALAPDEAWTGTLGGIAPGLVSSWVAYAGGTAWSLGQAGHALGGFDAAIASCVPLGAGLSSSAAIECAVALALDELFDLGLAASGDAGRAHLAAVCVRAENEVAGAPTGGMDQAASLRATAGHALLLDTLDHSVAQVPFHLAEAGLELLVIDTRAEHALVDGQYAARRAACHAAAARLGVGTLREVDDLPAALAALPDPVEQQRVRHVVTEIARVEQFVALVRDDRVREVGPLMDASHESLRLDYEVSCDELDVAVVSARAAGALGARMTGGGFGGSAIALVEESSVGAVGAAVTEAFVDRGWPEPGLLIASAAPGGARVRPVPPP
ncbi:MAG: galactokinase [Candidatus Nanopelagicales bacterium]|nr:galactokinase [Candidatus Nanopelagicales bacterium]